MAETRLPTDDLLARRRPTPVPDAGSGQVDHAVERPGPLEALSVDRPRRRIPGHAVGPTHRWPGGRGSPHQPGDGVIRVREALDQCGADQTGRAGDEDVHVRAVVVTAGSARSVSALSAKASARRTMAGERVGVGEVGTVGGAGNFDEFRVGRVLDQPCHRLSVPGGRLLTPGVQRRDGHRRDVERSLGDANGIELGQRVRARRPDVRPCPSRGGDPRPRHPTIRRKKRSAPRASRST